MAYSKRKAIMIHELSKLYNIELVSSILEIKKSSVKRAIRYSKKARI